MKHNPIIYTIIVAGLLVVASGALADKVAAGKKPIEREITLNVENMPVDTALEMLSMLSDMPIKMVGFSDTLPTVTANIVDVPLLDAVKYITSVSELEYTLDKNVIVVSPKKINLSSRGKEVQSHVLDEKL